MDSENTLQYEREIQAAPASVYRALSKSTGFREWLCDGATTEAAPGGRIVLWWNDGYVSSGKFTALEENKEISFTWHGHDEPQATIVRIILNAHNGGTKLELVHSGLGNGEAWDTAREEFDKGWRIGLENLVSVLETGKDLRIYNRPMLGITLSDFNAEIAARENIPVSEGVRLDGTIVGLGAEKAGLQQGDVVIAMDGKAVLTLNDLTKILDIHKAGDKIEVVFYRGPEQLQVQMELSGRPMPDIPWDPSELADRVQVLFSEMDAALEEAISNASEAEMEAKPAQDEWNAKEVIAHLLLVERENNIWIGDLLSDQERWTDEWGSNVYAPLQALTHTYPTTAQLMAALKSREAETVALLRRLPEEFTQRKAAYWRLAENLLNAPYHTRSHLPQIQAAIERAQQ